MITEKIKSLVSAVARLDFQSKIAYCYILSKRISSDYYTFSKIEHFGSPDTIEKTLQLIKNIALNQQISKSDVMICKDKLSQTAPDMDDFPGEILASFALNVCSILYECLEYIDDKDDTRLETVAFTSIRSLETYIQHINNINSNLRVTELDNYLIKNELMQNELQFQNELVNTLYLVQKIDINFLSLMERIKDNDLAGIVMQNDGLLTV